MQRNMEAVHSIVWTQHTHGTTHTLHDRVRAQMQLKVIIYVVKNPHNGQYCKYNPI
jgi:hypothetical protein